MSQKNFTNATGNWSVSDDGNISYLGGAVGVQELDIESGRLTAYADPIPQYEYNDLPGRGILWRNPVTGTILGFPGNSTDPYVRSTDDGATWQYFENPIQGYAPFVDQIGNFEPGPELFATNTDGSMTLFGTGYANYYTTDDGLTWIPWTSAPKGRLEGLTKIIYSEETDTWRVFGAIAGAGVLKTEYQGSDPNVNLSDKQTFNGTWGIGSRAMIFDDGKILFKKFTFDDIQADGTWKSTMILLKDSSSTADDNIFARYDLELDDADYSGGVGRPSFSMGKDTQGRSMAVVSYTRSNNTLGIRTSLDGQNWSDLSDQLDLPLVAKDGYSVNIWLEERQQWFVFPTKIGMGGEFNPQPGDGYVFKTEITGDLTSLSDATLNALVTPRIQDGVGSDQAVWFVLNHYSGETISVTDYTEINPPNLDLYWDGEKLATEPYVNNLFTNVQTDLTNCVKVESNAQQSIGGSSIHLNTEKVEFGKTINAEFGTVSFQTNLIYRAKQHATKMSTPQENDPNNLPTTISINRTEGYTQNGRDFGAFTTDWLKPQRFRDKVEIDLDPSGDYDAVNKKYVDSAMAVVVDDELKNLKVGTLPIGSSGEYSVAVGLQANFGGYVTDYAVGVGIDAKATTSAIAVGMGTEARPNAVAIGRGAQAWDNSMAIGAATWATYDHSIALGRGAKTEEDQQVMFGATPDFAYGKTLNLKTYGTMQATDFLDADGNSIVHIEVDEEKKVITVGTLEYAGDQGNSVAVGMKSFLGGYVQNYSVGVGVDAKAIEMSAAIGYSSEARIKSVAVGQGAQAWNSGVAIGNNAGSTHDYSVAIGERAFTEEPSQVMFGATPDDQYGTPLNLKTYGTMQATDFLDADGNSIIIRSGNYLPFTRGDYWFDEYDIPDILIADESFVGDGIYAKSLMADNLRISYGPISSRGGLRSDMLAGYFSGAQSFTIENTVFGGINITAVDADRPDELPFDLSDEEAMFLKSKTRSAQHALTVTHETLGRTVEIDKEGIIRANAFTDMEGNPIGGGGFDSSNYYTRTESDARYQSAGNYPESATVNDFVTLTQTQYDRLPSKDADTIYFIKE